jgi:hypothetical protein
MNSNEILERLISRTKSLHSTLTSIRTEEGNFHELDQDSIRHQLREMYTLSRQLDQSTTGHGNHNDNRQVELAEPVIHIATPEENSEFQTAIEAVLEESERVAEAAPAPSLAHRLEEEETNPSPSAWPDEPAIHAGLEDTTSAAQLIVTPTPISTVQHNFNPTDGHVGYTETETSKSVADRFSPSETVGDIILKNQPVQRVSDRLRSTPLNDLHESIGINERFSFINQLFKGDQARYFETINRLNGSHSQEEALHFLNQELLPGMAWKTPPAVWKDFVELVSRRYQA